MTTAATPLTRISDYVTSHAARDPDAVALIHDENRISYRALMQQVDLLAASLLAAGVRKGDRVATLSTPHPDFVVSLLAATSIGAIWLGLNPRYRLPELQHCMVDSGAKVLLAHRSLLGRSYEPEIDALRASSKSLGQIVLFDDASDMAGAIPMRMFLDRGNSISPQQLEHARADVDSRDPCLLVYTSGSTGAPKGALLHHRGIIDFAVLCNSLWPLAPHRIINYFPINHIGSVVDCMMPCLVAGGAQVMLEQFDPTACLELIERERITLWGSVPSVFQMQLALPDFARFDLSSVQLIAWGGAAMPRETIEQLRSICPKLATNYGMTETSSAITIIEPTDDLDILANTVGHPRPGAEVRLVDEQDHPVPVGQPGEIQVRSPGNFLGYWQRPDATAAAFTADGFFRTGDLGEQRADGRIRLIGRLKEMYKSGGYNVYPREVETVIETHPGVASAAVVSIPDPLWQEVGVAYVVLREPITTQQIAQHCRDRLANYKLPKHIVLVSELPLLPIGKVDKRTLRAWAERTTSH
ncbi:class I adenylate-forming enzyme family protein [Steroidobacter sp.]|uniref:class I adenylate-forming enzyme family protein n=1 Tax=Steroidobacter sp. TaxID=1978227 RepID=UPI001A5E193D|nr:class I adenylate-forming enzyme family protein [Steroidobacter sp.]MBL8270277.1 acyl--CoA ligase [Steroidobacter sp.]